MNGVVERTQVRVSPALDLLAWASVASIAGGGLVRAGTLVAPTLDRFWPAFAAEWPELVGAVLCCLGTLVFVEVLGRLHALPTLLLRKSAHISGALIMFAGGWFFESHWPVFAFAVLATALLAAGPRLGLLRPLHGPERHDFGDVVFPAGLYLAFVLGGDSLPVYSVAVLVMGISDVAAAIAGTSLGTPDWWVAKSWRSVAGSSAFLATAIVFTLGAVLLGGLPVTTGLLIGAVGVAIALTFVEAIAPLGLDNLTVPVAACFLMGAVIHAS